VLQAQNALSPGLSEISLFVNSNPVLDLSCGYDVTRASMHPVRRPSCPTEEARTCHDARGLGASCPAETNTATARLVAAVALDNPKQDCEQETQSKQTHNVVHDPPPPSMRNSINVN
jgi:hypothetical protein